LPTWCPCLLCRIIQLQRSGALQLLLQLLLACCQLPLELAKLAVRNETVQQRRHVISLQAIARMKRFNSSEHLGHAMKHHHPGGAAPWPFVPAAAQPRHQPAGKTARLVLMWYSLFGMCCALSG
jgi:hypothetical protein